MEELYKKYRPGVFKSVLGQEQVVAMLNGYLTKGKLPHFLLFTGPSGCGKTTLARILKNKLECADTDFVEINCADFRGIDMVREIRGRMGLSPLGGACRIWLIDEAHKLTGDAQNALLKMLEDTPKHVYFFMATTDPDKLIATIKTRATVVAVKALTPTKAKELVAKVLQREEAQLEEDVVDRLVETAEGSARKLLVLLGQVLELPNSTEQLQMLQSVDAKAQAIQLARALFNPRVTWTDVAKLLKEVTEDPESIRWMVLGYCSSIVLANKTPAMVKRALFVMNCFRDNYYDTKKAGLILSCSDVLGHGG